MNRSVSLILMTRADPEEKAPKERWIAGGTGAWYEEERWEKGRRRERDPAIVRSILARYLPARKTTGPPTILDAPCGTGRLTRAIVEFGACVGLDYSDSMLTEARAGSASALVRGDVTRLPFQSASFPVVLCCRLLHHLRTPLEIENTLRELSRVSSGIVAGSFWDAHSLAALRGRLPCARRPRQRVAHPKRLLIEALEGAGLEWVEWRHSARFFSRQTWFVARKKRIRA